ncbi:SHOCT domain-containing protein [Kribbella sp. NBC_01510]|uniref:SHOCT domain-containing protein n=1 Tax=Kribbella sp. NBC_01510 TaxID=2903581 RepID=UPI0038644E10
MMHSTGDGVGWILLVVTLWALVAGGAFWAGVRLIHQSRPRPTSLPSPLDILERRFAAGEITREDFDEARARLREHQLDR